MTNPALPMTCPDQVIMLKFALLSTASEKCVYFQYLVFHGLAKPKYTKWWSRKLCAIFSGPLCICDKTTVRRRYVLRFLAYIGSALRCLYVDKFINLQIAPSYTKTSYATITDIFAICVTNLITLMIKNKVRGIAYRPDWERWDNATSRQFNRM